MISARFFFFFEQFKQFFFYTADEHKAYLGLDAVQLAQTSDVAAVWYWLKHPLLFQVFCCKWLITLQNRARRTWWTDRDVRVRVRRTLRVLAARDSGKRRDWLKKVLEIVLMVEPRDKNEARQCDVTSKSRQPLSLGVRKQKACKETVKWRLWKRRRKKKRELLPRQAIALRITVRHRYLNQVQTWLEIQQRTGQFLFYLCCEGFFADCVHSNVWAVLTGWWNNSLIKELGVVDWSTQTLASNAVSVVVRIGMRSSETFHHRLEKGKGKWRYEEYNKTSLLFSFHLKIRNKSNAYFWAIKAKNIKMAWKIGHYVTSGKTNIAHSVTGKSSHSQVREKCWRFSFIHSTKAVWEKVWRARKFLTCTRLF